MLVRLIQKFIDFLYIKQWTIGCTRQSLDSLLEHKALKEPVTWLSIPSQTRFFADPFFTKGPDGLFHIFFEDYRYSDQYGKIAVTTLDEQFKTVGGSMLLDTGYHLSYPNLIRDSGKTYVWPENSLNGEVAIYEYDFAGKQLKNKETVFTNLPLLDATILPYEGKYWLFATHRGPDSNRHLHIYFADHWKGPYTAHPGNPVKNDLVGTRPAGQFLFHQGQIYRPTQNCGPYYGKSIILQKLVHLSEKNYVEEPVMELLPPKNTKYNFAIHTINIADDVIVIDGLRRIFAPWTQVRIFIRKKLNKFSGKK